MRPLRVRCHGATLMLWNRNAYSQLKYDAHSEQRQSKCPSGPAGGVNLSERGQQQPKGVQSWAHDINSPHCESEATFCVTLRNKGRTAEAPSWLVSPKPSISSTPEKLGDLRAALHRPGSANCRYPQWPTRDTDGLVPETSNCSGGVPQERSRGESLDTHGSSTHIPHTHPHTHRMRVAGVRGITACGSAVPGGILGAAVGDFGALSTHTRSLSVEESYSSELCSRPQVTGPRRPVIGLVHSKTHCFAASI